MHMSYAVNVVLCGVVTIAWAQTSTCTAVQPGGSQAALCGIRGDLDPVHGTYWSIANPAVASSLEECASICNGRRINKKQGQSKGQSWCRSFYYDSTNSRCGIGTHDVSHSVDANASSTRVFYSYRCFSCGAFCDQPYGQQLLWNGDFEKIPFGPWDTNGDSGPGYKSKAGWQAIAEGYLSQHYNQCRDYTYRFSFDYSITQDGSPAPEFRAFNGFYTFSDLTSTGTSGQWRSVVGFLQGPYLDFAAGPRDGSPKKGNNLYQVDNVVVSRFPSNPQTQPLAQQAFQNAGFESGQLAPWSFTNNPSPNILTPPSIVSPGIDGSKKALFVAVKEETNFFQLHQTMETKPDSNYVISFDYIISAKLSDPDHPVSVALLYGQDGIQTSVNDLGFPLNHGKGTFSFPIGVRNTQTLMTFEFSLSIFWKTGNVTLDNFRLEEIKG